MKTRGKNLYLKYMLVLSNAIQVGVWQWPDHRDARGAPGLIRLRTGEEEVDLFRLDFGGSSRREQHHH